MESGFGWLRLARIPAMAALFEKRRMSEENGNRRRLFIDVSVICRHDAKTGIQRVVRAFWAQLSKLELRDIELVPVFANGWLGYCLADSGMFNGAGGAATAGNRRISVRAGDIFFGLDLSPAGLWRNRRQLRRWKKAGVAVHLMVYDLLPVLQPQWFSDPLRRRFTRWLRVLAMECDQAICISEQVAHDLSAWLGQHHAARIDRIRINHIPLGGDIVASLPTQGLPDDAGAILAWMRAEPSFLMVSTVEPRKGYDQVLDAFEHLWAHRMRESPRLVIVGRPGWMTEDLQARIRRLEGEGRGLRWLSDVSDAYLETLYAESFAILVASWAEGFGLPIVEGLAHGKFVLARDLPVFREIASPDLHFFSAANGEELAEAIEAGMAARRNSVRPVGASPLKWLDCTRSLLTILGIGERNDDVRSV